MASCSSDQDAKSDDPSEESKDETVQTPDASNSGGESDPTLSEGSQPIEDSQEGKSRAQPTSGIRPVQPHMLGLCRLKGPDASKKDCNDYLPSDIDQLPPGSYVLHAGLHVPKELAGQSVQFVTYCRKNGTDGERREGKPSTGSVSPGNPETGYRFWGTSIDVPDDAAWASDCTWEFSAGDNRFVGSWTF